MKRALLLVSTAFLTACSSSPNEQRARPTVEPPAPLVRTCDSAVFGDSNMENAVTIGPLVLVGIPQAAALPARAFEPHAGRYGAIKVLAVVTTSSDVTVSVPESQRRSVSLLYDPDARATENGFRFSAGDPRVTFESCPDGDAQYNGGFIAIRPTCVKLEVGTPASSTSGWVSLGAGRTCPT
jgi:hypothetical protein